jgi:hypothetical protein
VDLEHVMFGKIWRKVKRTVRKVVRVVKEVVQRVTGVIDVIASLLGIRVTKYAGYVTFFRP